VSYGLALNSDDDEANPQAADSVDSRIRRFRSLRSPRPLAPCDPCDPALQCGWVKIIECNPIHCIMTPSAGNPGQAWARKHWVRYQVRYPDSRHPYMPPISKLLRYWSKFRVTMISETLRYWSYSDIGGRRSELRLRSQYQQ
jgi:hypothetical protein